MALPGVDAMFQLKEASDSRSVHVIGHGRATEFDGAGEHIDQGLAQPLELCPGDACCLPARADTGARESFIGVDVADAVQQRLIEQGRFDGSFTTAEEPGEVCSGDPQRLFAGAGVGLAMDGEAAEASWIDEANLAPITERENGMGVRRERTVGMRDQETAGHAEVDEKLCCFRRDAVGAIERHDDRLAHSSNAADGGAGQHFLDLGFRTFEGLRFAAGPNVCDALTAHPLMDAVGNGFDFRQFRQASLLPVGC